jgi:hypothetical protein
MTSFDVQASFMSEQPIMLFNRSDVSTRPSYRKASPLILLWAKMVNADASAFSLARCTCAMSFSSRAVLMERRLSTEPDIGFSS